MTLALGSGVAYLIVRDQVADQATWDRLIETGKR